MKNPFIDEDIEIMSKKYPINKTEPYLQSNILTKTRKQSTKPRKKIIKPITPRLEAKELTLQDLNDH